MGIEDKTAVRIPEVDLRPAATDSRIKDLEDKVENLEDRIKELEKGQNGQTNE
jgi:uncharacterized protein YdcH (DUF465 family)